MEPLCQWYKINMGKRSALIFKSAYFFPDVYISCKATHLHHGGQCHWKHAKWETQDIEECYRSKGLLCIQDVVLIHHHIDSKGTYRNLGERSGGERN